MPLERWEPTPGYPDYEVSSHGRVRTSVPSQKRHLSEAQVLELRDRYAAGGESYRSLASEFGVGTHTVARAVVRQTYSPEPRVMKQGRAGLYRAVRLRNGEGNRLVFVHRLVAEAFLPQAEGRHEVNHRDGDKENNRPENLEWVTHAENMAHAIDSGLWDPFEASRRGHKARWS